MKQVELKYNKYQLLRMRLNATVSMFRRASEIGGFITPLGVMNQELADWVIQMHFMRAYDENLLLWENQYLLENLLSKYSSLYGDDYYKTRDLDVLWTAYKLRNREDALDYTVDPRSKKKRFALEGLFMKHVYFSHEDILKIVPTQSEKEYCNRIMSLF